jgi:hypothetical protein
MAASSAAPCSIFKRADGVFDKPKLQAILTFLDNYVRFENPENNRIFRNEVDQTTGKKNTMDIFEQVAEWTRLDGIEEGMEKGRSAEKENSVRLFLANTEFSPEKIASLVEVPLALVEKIKNEMRSK